MRETLAAGTRVAPAGAERSFGEEPLAGKKHRRQHP